MFTIPVIEGHQGTHRFFTGSVRWGVLDRMLVFPEDLEELDDDHRMQRGLARRRLQDLEKYLLEAPDHFFSALTLVILPRDLGRGAVEATEDSFEWDFMFKRMEQEVPGQHRPGLLHLSGDVMLFPADGQHRAAAARMALKRDAGLAREEVPVVLMAFDEAGQVRQLFSDLNLNAKPVSKTLGYDFETRDPIAVMAKEISEKVELFSGRTQRRTNSLPASSADVITLNTLVQGTRAILSALADHSEGAPDRVHEYLDTVGIASATNQVVSVWEIIIEAFDKYWSRVLSGDITPGDLRKQYLFPHGLGWLGLSTAAGQLISDHGPEAWGEPFTDAVQSFDWQRSAPTWAGSATIHNPESGETDPNMQYRVNNTGPAIKGLASVIVAAAANA